MSIYVYEIIDYAQGIANPSEKHSDQFLKRYETDVFSTNLTFSYEFLRIQ